MQSRSSELAPPPREALRLLQAGVTVRGRVDPIDLQRQADRTPGLAGTIVIHFAIAADGTVSRSSVAPGTSLHNDQLLHCVQGQIKRLRFPAKGPAIVNCPFAFSSANQEKR